ncbi:hypothetical protein VP01_1162g11 [Puccinia sorghi]|uniref:Uncharacterized protein n=1 Tax=Puccinia sorghi TaxID=27349 RepID=A0A0L6VRL9_9BASI|nr:hypothetical protein VP01_1162g11 [Puccinia sorghi]
MNRPPGLEDNPGRPPQQKFPLQNSYTNRQGGTWTSPNNSRGLNPQYHQASPGPYYNYPGYSNGLNYPSTPGACPALLLPESCTQLSASNKCKPRRTPEQIRIAEAMIAQKKVQKATKKAGIVQKKAATKLAKELIKAGKLLALVKIIQDEYEGLSKRPGFTPFGKYFLANDHHKVDFPLLEKVKNDSLEAVAAGLSSSCR